MGSSELIYGADELPLMLDQSVFSITMRNTVRMADVGSVVVVGGRVVVVVVVVVGGRVVVVGEGVVGGRLVVVVVVRVMVAVGAVVVVVVVLVRGRGMVVVVVERTGGVTVRLNVPCAPPYPSTTMKYVCPAVTVGVRREARYRPVALVQASSLQPAATSGPLAQAPLRM